MKEVEPNYNESIRIMVNGTVEGNTITGTFTRVTNFGSYGTETRKGNFVINKK